MSEQAVIRLATRGSPLALWQANRVATLLHRTGTLSSLVVVETDGDRRVDIPLDRLGGQGVFVKEVQAAVARGDADAAVHSAKDLPASPDHGAPGLVLVAIPERADVRDMLVGGTLSSLPAGSTVATGSARRRAQLANHRPDLTFSGLRGNLATRLSTAGKGGIAAVVVAKAAIDRLGWSPPDGLEIEVLDTTVMLPQVGQGALAVECRVDDGATRAAMEAVHDPIEGLLVEAERAYLSELGGGCTMPVGAHARWVDGDPGAGDGTAGMELTGMMASADGLVILRHAEVGHRPGPLGQAVARYLLDAAGGHGLGEWAPVSDDDGPGGPSAVVT